MVPGGGGWAGGWAGACARALSGRLGAGRLVLFRSRWLWAAKKISAKILSRPPEYDGDKQYDRPNQ